MTSRYDEYKVLFTNNMRDDRPNLYLSMLADYMKVGQGKSSNRSLTKFELNFNGKALVQAANVHFQSANENVIGLDDNAVHPQWLGFIIDVARQRSGCKENSTSSSAVDATVSSGKVTEAKVSKANSDKILAIIRKLSSVTVGSGSFEEMMIDVVKHLMKSIDGSTSGSASINNANSWVNATKFEYNTDISNLLFSDVKSTDLKVVLISDAITKSLSGKLADTDINGSGLLKDVWDNFGDLVNKTGNKIYPHYVHQWKKINAIQNSDDATYQDPFKTTPVLPDAGWQAFNTDMKSDAGSTNPTEKAKATALANEILQKLGKLRDRTDFGFKWTLYLVKMLLKEAASKLTPTDLDTLFPKDESSTDLPRYYRNAAGELLEIKNGKAVNVLSQSEYLEAINKQCHTTAVNQKNNNGKTCTDYFKDCLIGQDIEACKEYLNDNGFWKDMEKEIREMHPTMAHKTLKAFGFKGVQREITNRSGKKIKLVFMSSYEDWIQSLKTNTKMQPGDITNITQNTKLEAYLKALIKLINENPGILNTDYVQDPKNPVQQTSTTSLSTKYGLKMYTPNSTAVSDSERLRLFNQDHTARVRLSLNPLLLVGGAPQQTNQWIIFQAQYNALVNQLKANGKTILPKDDESVRSLINSLKDSETKLHKIMQMTSKYNQLLSAYGEIDGTNSPLTLAHLKEFVDKRAAYFEKVASKQRNLISVIQAVSEAAVSHALSGNAQSTTSKNFVDI